MTFTEFLCLELRVKRMACTKQQSGLVTCSNLRSFYLVTGYLRNAFDINQLQTYEKSLGQIIMQLLGNIFVKFDVYPLKCEHMICDEGKCIRRCKGDPLRKFMIGTSNGWYYGSHSISFEVSKCPWYNAAYGVTTNISAFGGGDLKWVGDVKTGNHYGLFYGNIGGLEDGYQDRIKPQRNVIELKQEKDENKEEMISVITIKFNASDIPWKLSFYLNHKLIGKPVEIVEDCKYFPFMGFFFDPKFSDEEYRILV